MTLTLLKVGCNLWGYIKQLLSYRYLINRISRWLKQFKTQFKTKFKTQFKEVKLINSKVKSTLPSSLKEQLARIYGEFSTKDGILVSRIPCQQQEGALDCGLFSIVTAYHMARGDAPQRFDQSLMRQQLMACFEKQAPSPFPQVAGKKLSISVMKHLFIPVHCICKMPESYGSRMYFYYRRTRTLCLYDESLNMFYRIGMFSSLHKQKIIIIIAYFIFHSTLMYITLL